MIHDKFYSNRDFWISYDFNVFLAFSRIVFLIEFRFRLSLWFFFHIISCCYNLFILSILLYSKSNSRISNGYKLVYRRCLEMEGQKRTMAARRSHAAKYLKINVDRLVHCQYYAKLFDCLSFSKNLFLEIFSFTSNSFAFQLLFLLLFTYAIILPHLSHQSLHHQFVTNDSLKHEVVETI